MELDEVSIIIITLSVKTGGETNDGPVDNNVRLNVFWIICSDM